MNSQAQSGETDRWEYWSWVIQLGFYLFYLAILARALGRLTQYHEQSFYLMASTAWVFVGALNAAFLRPPLRRGVAIAVAMTNVFLLPYALLSCKTNPGMAAFIGALYLATTLVATPRDIGVCLLMAGLGFSCTLKQRLVYGGTGMPTLDYLKLASAYFGMGLVAFVWRVFIMKLYRMLVNAPASVSASSATRAGEDGDADGTFEAYMKLDREHRRLKQGLAKHILKIHEAVDKSMQGLDASS